jgi:hypothetical protein
LSATIYQNVSSQWYKDGQPFGLPNTGAVYATQSGVYHLEVTNDLLLCNHSFDAIIVQINPLPLVSAGPDVTICEGNVWYFYAGDESLNYTWSNGVPNGYPSLILQSESITLLGIDGNGCSNSDTAMVTVLPNFINYYDGDGDGFGTPGWIYESCFHPQGFVTNSTDCDDNNATININAAEICDGQDDNCNGLADDGLVFINYYVDFDSDGFGSSNTMQNTCYQPAGFVTNALDCNDASSYVNPDAIEICNGLDEDCNGENDNSVVFATFYEDADGDTYGDPATGQDFCLIPTELFVANGDDCDDTNSTINPAATEVWENGIDDDCNPNTSDVSIDEWSAFAFNLFPNPTEERITISRASSEATPVEIFNSLGALVHTFNVFGSQAIIDVSVFPAGYYVVRVNGRAKTFLKS